MHAALAIAQKEISIFFTTVIAYTGFGAYAFLMGLLFNTALNRFQQYTQAFVARQQPELLEQLNFNDSIIVPMMSTGLWMFLFFVPFSTMRLFAEEKSARTFELLMTAPIRSVDMVLGKFLGVALTIAILTAIPLIFPLILHVYGTGVSGGSGVEWSPILSGSCSVFLLGLLFCSIGIAISALTESQVVAAILTFAALLVAFTLPMIASRLEGDARAFLAYLAPVSHATRGLEGRWVFADLVYFPSTTALFLFLATRIVESHRWRG